MDFYVVGGTDLDRQERCGAATRLVGVALERAHPVRSLELRGAGVW